MKVIKYQKTVDMPDNERSGTILVSCQIECEAMYVDSNIVIAREEAYLGKVTVEDAPDAHRELM